MNVTAETAIITGSIGLVFLAARALIARAVSDADKRAVKAEAEIINLRERVLQLEGTVNSAWGLVPAVSKLDHNVERLTSAVENIGATVETLMRLNEAPRSRT